MILIIGGTSDANRLANKLTIKGLEFIMTVTSLTGQNAANAAGVKAIIYPFTPEKIETFMKEQHITKVLDASHPHAGEISKQVIKVCDQLGVLYIRYERPTTEIKEENHLHLVNSMEEAVHLASSYKSKVLVTGSKHVKLWRNSDCHVVYRVLPTSTILKDLEGFGVDVEDIIAQKGPFSYEANLAHFQDFEIVVFVCKESGSTSNTLEKIAAALKSGLECIVVKRPVINYPNTYATDDAILQLLEEIK